MNRLDHNRQWLNRAQLRLTSHLVALLFFLSASSAVAVPITDVASAFDEDDPFDFNVRVSYEREARSGYLVRELSGADSTRILHVKELSFSHVQQRLPLRAEIGLGPDFMIYTELPLILSDRRQLDFDQNAGAGCGTPPETGCVTPNNSTLVRDGLLDSSAMSQTQVNVAGSAEQAGSLFLPKRAGLDQVRLGLAWGVLSNRRESTKPSWLLGFEARLGIGTVMRYNPQDPKANTSVGQGLHQYRMFSAISKRYRYVDPWFSMYYMLPQATGGSLFEKTRFSQSGQERSGPQHEAGAEAGLEIIAWENAPKVRKISVEFSGRMDAFFEGRGYSEMWELLANNPRLAGPCVADASQATGQSDFPGAWNNGAYCGQTSDAIPYPGITSIENYAFYGLRVGLNAEWTKWARGRIGFGYGSQSSHYVTYGDAGNSGSSSGQLSMTNEHQLNPMYRPIIDAPGRRFIVESQRVWDFFVGAEGRF